MSKVYHMRQMRQRIQRLQGDPSGTDHRRLYGFKKENLRWLASLFVGNGPSKDYLTNTEKIKLCLQFLTDPGVDTKVESTRVVNTTISNIISGTISNIVAKANMWIQFPRTPQEILDAKIIWGAESDFPNAVGVVGCIRVRLQKCQIYGDEYMSSDGEHTLKVLATCDGRGMFSSVDASWPGSADENLMWAKSMPRYIMSNSTDSVLLADESYDKEPCLLTPFQIPENKSQLIYNELLNKERVAIDQCFEQLRRRFRILNCTFCLKPKAIREIIIACFVLHNIALRMGEEDMPEYVDPYLETADGLEDTESVSSKKSLQTAGIKGRITSGNIPQDTERVHSKKTLQAADYKAPIKKGNVLLNRETANYKNAQALVTLSTPGNVLQDTERVNSKNTVQAADYRVPIIPGNKNTQALFTPSTPGNIPQDTERVNNKNTLQSADYRVPIIPGNKNTQALFTPSTPGNIPQDTERANSNNTLQAADYRAPIIPGNVLQNRETANHINVPALFTPSTPGNIPQDTERANSKNTLEAADYRAPIIPGNVLQNRETVNHINVQALFIPSTPGNIPQDTERANSNNTLEATDYRAPIIPGNVLQNRETVNHINVQALFTPSAPGNIPQETERANSNNTLQAADYGVPIIPGNFLQNRETANHINVQALLTPITLGNIPQDTERANSNNTLQTADYRVPIIPGNVLQNRETANHINVQALITPSNAPQNDEKASTLQTAGDIRLLIHGGSPQNAKQAPSENTNQAPVHDDHAKQNNISDIISLDKVQVLKCEVIHPPRQMMSNSGATFGNGIQQHNLTTAIDYLNQNGPATLATYPNVTTTDPGLVLDKQPAAAYYTTQSNPQAFYSTQLVRQAPGTILITNNFGPDESSTISGVNNNFNNSSIRIVTHNNNNSNHTNNNKTVLLDDANCKLIADKQQQQQPQLQQQQQQHYHQLHHLHHQSSPVALPITLPPSTSPPNPVKIPNSLVSTTAPVPTTTSTVVLDRINICINNHYGDATTMTTPTVVPPQSGSLPSPIIPPVIMSQHTTIVETLPPSLCSPSLKPPHKSCDTELHVDEPDSTTPANCHSDLVIPMEQDQDLTQEQDKSNSFDEFPIQKFEIGEDALVKRRDGRYYLGTVVDVHRQQYLVQFDDKTDYWSNVDELLKLSTDVVSKEKASCLACKRDNDEDVVEICERCGRGYHRQCTDEVTSKSGEWMCKRCVKPMKLSAEDDVEEKPRFQKVVKADFKKFNKQFPYALDSLTWDEKHRVNDEHIYCYCGKSGQFDNNMIQCCKCKQWFHVHCVGCVNTLFRGDVFFIFGCSVCNDGTEFLRRIEMEWVDLAHLILYNMAIMKNFQKYHHLHKDIYPFALEKRPVLQLPQSMLSLSDNDFKANILKTMQAHPTLFQCGKEIKKDHAFWGLRANKPPQGPTYEVGRCELLCNQLIREKLKINILPYGDGDDPRWISSMDDADERLAVEADKHIPEVKTEQIAKPDQVDDDDDKFTSDDEIPIKLIIEKVKALTSPVEEREQSKPTLQDDSGISDQSNDNPTDEKEKPEEKDTLPVVKPQQKSSRKRKAFTLSKGYKESDKSNDSPRNICDSSSDENSSSSRGTLDLIIPPPKNFLGINNPFLMLTPKKSDNNTSAVNKKTGSNYTKKTVSFGSNSIFTNTLDLNSKIAALKSSGLLPNISNSDMAKAAGQPRLVRTIKRRLSAKDIKIGPNQEVRRRRTRPSSSNVEVISTTAINSIPSNFFPIRTTIPEPTNSSKSQQTNSQSNPSASSSSSSASTSNADSSIPSATVTPYGRRLRKRPEKTSPQNSRRNSICSSSSNSSTGAVANQLAPPSSSSQSQNTVSMCDLKQSVNKYFGAANRIENGENFTIRAKRRLTNGQMQYLIEWES